MYRNVQYLYTKYNIFAFKVLQESSSWVSGNGAVRMFFLAPNRNMFAGKFVNWGCFLAVFWRHMIFSFKRVEICKMSEVSWAKLYYEMSDLFSLVFIGFEIFCYKFWNNKNSDDVHRNVWNKVVRLRQYFQKKNYRYEILNHLYFGPSFVFWVPALGRFSQCFFFIIIIIFVIGQPWRPTFLLSSPTMKKLPMALY